MYRKADATLTRALGGPRLPFSSAAAPESAALVCVFIYSPQPDVFSEKHRYVVCTRFCEQQHGQGT